MSVAELSDEEFSRVVQEKALTHIEACMEALDAEQFGDGTETRSPAIAPFDGCTTCIAREILSVCWEMMWERAQAEAREEAQ